MHKYAIFNILQGLLVHKFLYTSAEYWLSRLHQKQGHCFMIVTQSFKSLFLLILTFIVFGMALSASGMLHP